MGLLFIIHYGRTLLTSKGNRSSLFSLILSLSFSSLFSYHSPPFSLTTICTWRYLGIDHCVLEISLPILVLSQVFVKSELKVGVIYVKENQYTEEEIFDNCEHR